MIIRQCAGGVVFFANQVLLVKNDRGEWTLPKGYILESELPYQTALDRVKQETGVDGEILEVAGDTMYEFYSRTRKKQVTNAITWYIIDAKNNECKIREDFPDGGFFKVKDALELLTHNKESSLVEVSYRKYKEIKKSNLESQRVALNCE